MIHMLQFQPQMGRPRQRYFICLFINECAQEELDHYYDVIYCVSISSNVVEVDMHADNKASSSPS